MAEFGGTLTPNAYGVEVYLDAVLKAEVAFQVSETTAGFKMSASELVAFLSQGGQTCAEPVTVDGGMRVTCLTTGTDRDIGTETIVALTPPTAS